MSIQAMILAAGKGERLRPLTETLPKPLIDVGNAMLIEHHLIKLANSNFTNIIINVSYLYELIENKLGDGRQYELNISYSREIGGAFGTAAGIANALPLFNSDSLLVINGDIYTDYNFANISIADNSLAHLILVPNPPHNPLGDFAFKNGNVTNDKNEGENCWTFSGIGCYRKEVFDDLPADTRELAPVLRDLIDKNQATAEIHDSLWIDVGTIERLESARIAAVDSKS